MQKGAVVRAEGSHAPDSACASGRRGGPRSLWQIPGGLKQACPFRAFMGISKVRVLPSGGAGTRGPR